MENTIQYMHYIYALGELPFTDSNQPALNIIASDSVLQIETGYNPFNIHLDSNLI